MNTNLYISESCGTCAHREVCARKYNGNSAIAAGLAERDAPICAKYQTIA